MIKTKTPSEILFEGKISLNPNTRTWHLARLCVETARGPSLLKPQELGRAWRFVGRLIHRLKAKGEDYYMNKEKTFNQLALSITNVLDHPESFADMAADLALSVANAMEHPDCPRDLSNELNEVTNELINVLSPKPSALLRALADLAKSGNGGTRTEAETLNAGNPGAKAEALNGAP